MHQPRLPRRVSLPNLPLKRKNLPPPPREPTLDLLQHFHSYESSAPKTSPAPARSLLHREPAAAKSPRARRLPTLPWQSGPLLVDATSDGPGRRGLRLWMLVTSKSGDARPLAANPSGLQRQSRVVAPRRFAETPKLVRVRFEYRPQHRRIIRIPDFRDAVWDDVDRLLEIHQRKH